MEEENMIGEQPEITQEGSSFGKFKDAESLKSAYENLEKEFTRKSQALADLQKSNDVNSKKDDFISTFSINNDNNEKFWCKEEWDSQVNDFLSSNPKAQKYSREICELIIKDKDVQESEQPLLMAWSKFLANNFQTEDEMIDDELKFSKITKNEKVKKAIIDDYLLTLKNRDFVPPVFSKSESGGLGASKPQPPKTLEDAKELVKKMFK